MIVLDDDFMQGTDGNGDAKEEWARLLRISLDSKGADLGCLEVDLIVYVTARIRNKNRMLKNAVWG